MGKKLLGEIELNRIYQRDCIEGMRSIPNDSVDLIVIDPPYNIGKDKRWDKWQTVDTYVSFMSVVFTECERVLKPSGSFYFFHNDMEQISRLMQEINAETPFIFKQMITWNKRFDSARNKGFLDGFVEVGGLRNYQKMAEYCLFYTKITEDTGLNWVLNNALREVREYLNTARKSKGITLKYINEKLGVATNGGGRASSIFTNPSTLQFPLEKYYEVIKEVLGLEKTYEELKLFYEDRRAYYDSLQSQHESRYTYNNQKTHHSVWNYEIAQKQGHVTPKPLELIENIIRHSSNEGDVVLDCFMGSGTTAVAAVRLKRNFIGFERESEYIEIANKRLDAETEVNG